MSLKDSLKNYKLMSVAYAGIAICVIAIVFTYSLLDKSHWLFAPLNAIFTAFATTLLVSIIYDVYAKRHADQEMSQLIRSSVDDVISNKLKINAYGLSAIHEKFNYAEFEGHVRDAKSIFVLQTYAPNLAELRNVILLTLKRGTSVDVALLSPSSLFVDTRSRELGTSKDTFVGDLLSNVERLKQWSRENKGPGKIEVKQYDGAPGVCIYATDQVMFVGSYLRGMDAISAPFIEIRSESKLYEIYLEHFKSIWKDAEEISL